MVEGTTIAYTGAIQLAYNRGQYSHRTPGKEKCACYTSTTSRRHHTKISKAKQTTTLSTQDLDQALTYCVNMVQQISYTQEMKDLMEQQEVASTRYLKTLHPFIDQEGHLRVGG